MATYELIYETAGNQDRLHIHDYHVTPAGGLIFYHGSPKKESTISPNAEWVLTALPTETTYCGISHEDAWFNLHFKTAGQQETVGIETHREEDDGTLSFRRMDGRHGRLDPSAEWHITDQSARQHHYEQDREETVYAPVVEPNTLPSNWDTLRKQVYEKDAYTCQYCRGRGGEYGDAELHAHHLVPKEYGGVHSLHNLLTFCQKCHLAVHKKRAAPEL